ILRDQPLSPSTLRADVPTALEDIVLTLLQKDPANRYPAAEELVAHLVGAGTRAESAVRSGRTRSLGVRRILSGRRQWTVGGLARRGTAIREPDGGHRARSLGHGGRRVGDPRTHRAAVPDGARYTRRAGGRPKARRRGHAGSGATRDWCRGRSRRLVCSPGQ